MSRFTSRITKTLPLWSIPLLSLLWSAPAHAQCVDFLPLGAPNPLPDTFTHSGYQFEIAPLTSMSMNDTIDVAGNLAHGVRFPPSPGLRVRLPAPSMSVAIEIGAFHPPDAVTIRGISASGAVVAKISVPADNLIHAVVLNSTTPMVGLWFSGGGNEAVLIEICS